MFLLFLIYFFASLIYKYIILHEVDIVKSFLKKN
nr:MAG TPA: hypothetical protein [Caudoviricetes sp.]